MVPLSEETYRRLKIGKAHTDLSGDELIRMIIDLSGVTLDEEIMTDARVREWIEKNVVQKIKARRK